MTKESKRKSPDRKKSLASKPALRIPHTSHGREDSLSQQSENPLESRYFRRTLLMIVTSFLLMLSFFTIFFFLAVRGEERTVVPDVVNKKLIDALVLLQERELYPRVQAKYTGNPQDKNFVLSQDPEPGLYVKAGRRVVLSISRGAIADKVEDYLGQSLTQVRARLRTLYSTYQPLLVIREPVAYVYDESAPGTIISQYPSASSPITDFTDLIVIVSRGDSDPSITLPNFVGLSSQAAMLALAELVQPFVFSEDSSTLGGTTMLIDSQSPPAFSEIAPKEKVVLQSNPPELIPEGFRYGFFDHTLPDYPVPVMLELFVQEQGKIKDVLFTMPHLGSRISFPYLVPLGSSIVLTVNGKELVRRDVLSDE